MSDIQYLTAEHMYLIHRMAIDEFGGFDGIYDNTEGKIESILAQQYPIFGHDKYPSIFQKAAMLLYFFSKGHCFCDGNKRIGIQSAIVFLDINGYQDNLDELEGYSKTIEVTTSEISEHNRDNYINSLAGWLSKRF